MSNFNAAEVEAYMSSLFQAQSQIQPQSQTQTQPPVKGKVWSKSWGAAADTPTIKTGLTEDLVALKLFASYDALLAKSKPVISTIPTTSTKVGKNGKK